MKRIVSLVLFSLILAVGCSGGTKETAQKADMGVSKVYVGTYGVADGTIEDVVIKDDGSVKMYGVTIPASSIMKVSEKEYNIDHLLDGDSITGTIMILDNGNVVINSEYFGGNVEFMKK